MANLAGAGPRNLPRERELLLEALVSRSELPVAVQLRSGTDRVAAIRGWWATPGQHAIDRAADFVETHKELLGVLPEWRNDPEPEVCDGSGGATIVTFPFQLSHPFYACGVSVELVRGAVTGYVARFPLRQPADLDPRLSRDLARKVVGELAGLEDADPPELAIFDPDAVFGDPGSPTLAWVFEIATADLRADLLLDAREARILGAFPRPAGCLPIEVVPRFHPNALTGTCDFITFAPDGLLLPEASSNSPARVAWAIFQRYPRLFGTGDPVQQLSLLDVTSDADPAGMTHVTFQQLYGGLPVWGAQLKVHLASESLAVRSIAGTYLREPGVGVTPSLPASRAHQVVDAWRCEQRTQSDADVPDGRALLRPGDERPSFVVPHRPRAELVILPGVLSASVKRNHLAWLISWPEAHCFVSARTGDMVLTASRVPAARIVRNRVLDYPNPGDVTDADILRDGVDLLGNASQADFDCDADLARVLEFWRLYGRNSWNGAGGDLIAVRVQSAGGGTGSGGLWLRDYAAFAPGDDRDDFVAHEFTHGLIETTASLVYRDESGAVNEHLADVFGNLVFPDPGGTGSGWQIGETTAIGAIRDMANPAAGAQPGHYRNYATMAVDEGGVHINSGIGNLAAVRLCDGDGSPAHGGIGRRRLSGLFYEVLTERLFPWATYSDELLNAWEAARDLAARGYDAPDLPWSGGLPGVFDAAVASEVVWAFQQVGIDPQLFGGWYQVRGNATRAVTRTFFEGRFVPAGMRVSDVQLTLQTGEQPRTWSGVARVSTGGTVTDPSGTYTVTIVRHDVGGSSMKFDATLISSNFEEVRVQPFVFLEAVPGAAPPPPDTHHPDAPVAHWFDNPFFLGRSYDDTLNSGRTIVGPGCSIADVYLEILDRDHRVRGTQRLGDPDARWGGTGARITSRTLGGTDMTVGVRSWHDFGSCVRYRLVYVLRGGVCALP